MTHKNSLLLHLKKTSLQQFEAQTKRITSFDFEEAGIPKFSWRIKGQLVEFELDWLERQGELFVLISPTNSFGNRVLTDLQESLSHILLANLKNVEHLYPLEDTDLSDWEQLDDVLATYWKNKGLSKIPQALRTAKFKLYSGETILWKFATKPTRDAYVIAWKTMLFKEILSSVGVVIFTSITRRYEFLVFLFIPIFSFMRRWSNAETQRKLQTFYLITDKRLILLHGKKFKTIPLYKVGLISQKKEELSLFADDHGLNEFALFRFQRLRQQQIDEVYQILAVKGKYAQINAKFERLSQQYGLTYEHTMFDSSNRACQLKGKIKDFDISFSLEGKIGISCKLTLKIGLANPSDYFLRLSFEKAYNNLLLPNQDFEIGSYQFDKLFLIRTNNGELTTKLLKVKIRQKIEKLFHKTSASKLQIGEYKKEQQSKTTKRKFIDNANVLDLHLLEDEGEHLEQATIYYDEDRRSKLVFSAVYGCHFYHMNEQLTGAIETVLEVASSLGAAQ